MSSTRSTRVCLRGQLADDARGDPALLVEHDERRDASAAPACRRTAASPCRRASRSTGRARRTSARTPAPVVGGVAEVDADELGAVAELGRGRDDARAASARHGAHHEPHTMTTTGLPRKSATSIGLAVEVLARRARPGPPRSAASTVRIAPSPVTKPLSPVPSQRRAGAEGERAAGTAARRRASRCQGVLRALLLGRAAGRERRLLVLDRDQVAGGLGVAHLGDPVADEVQRGQRAQRALPASRVVQLAAALDVQAGGPDRQLVGDDHGLVADRRRAGVLDRRHHPGDDLLVRLAPGRPDRVVEVPPDASGA